MSTNFHETKSERKFYEGEKQTALKKIDVFIRNLEQEMAYNPKRKVDSRVVVEQLKSIKYWVDKI